VGLYDLDRRIRPVGEAYRAIVAQWSAALNAPAATDIAARRASA